jgi:hypothetical protein
MKLYRATSPDGTPRGWLVYCPACKRGHLFDQRWKFNGDRDAPTFDGSMLVQENPGYQPRCHSFLRDGVWEFLDDSTHQVRGKVPMEDFPDE